MFQKKAVLKIIVLVLFILGFIYCLIPSPKSIDAFPPLPNSLKSDLEGDTIQNPNIAAYFSDFDRKFITNYYKEIYSKKLFFGISLPVIRLNHPPELAYKYIRDQQESTFLEEYIFPLHESLFVNGYEPQIENQMHHNETSYWGDRIDYYGHWYLSKATLRYYPSSIYSRVAVYLGIWATSIWLIILFKKAIKNE